MSVSIQIPLVSSVTCPVGFILKSISDVIQSLELGIKVLVEVQDLFHALGELLLVLSANLEELGGGGRRYQVGCPETTSCNKARFEASELGHVGLK